MSDIEATQADEPPDRPSLTRAHTSFDPFSSQSKLPLQKTHPRRPFKSSRLREAHPKPWLKRVDGHALVSTAILYTGALTGFGLGFMVAYFDLKNAPLAKFCDSPFWEDSITSLDPETWAREVQLGWAGTGSFDWTTTDDKNAYVDDHGLHIVPTLTTETTNITDAQILHGYRLNLTDGTHGGGVCTAEPGPGYIATCTAFSNGTVIINPVRSARLTTKKSLKMTYGKIEIQAKLPAGDWLWPAIWMAPVDNEYGVWPRSGEIDIMESRGNDPTTYPDGRDTFTSAVHWGPNSFLDGFWRLTFPVRQWRKDFSRGFHTYAMEWTPNYIYTYYDNKLQGILYEQFGGGHGDMWDQGLFEGAFVNESVVNNPWADAAPNAPFDKDFYLILNVAVGGTNGYFSDGACFKEADGGQTYCEGNKPWRNDSPQAMADFWQGKSEWYPTWGQGDTRGMTVRSIKAYKYGGC